MGTQSQRDLHSQHFEEDVTPRGSFAACERVPLSLGEGCLSSSHSLPSSSSIDVHPMVFLKTHCQHNDMTSIHEA